MRLPAFLIGFASAVLAACAPAEPAVPAAAAPPALSAAAIPQTTAAATAAPVDGAAVDLGASPTFLTNSADLAATSENDAYVARAVDWLRAHPTVHVRVEVHSDGQGAEDYNQRMSQARADRLVGLFVDRGVDADRLRPVGMGKTHPIAPNTTAEGRAANRRVELHPESPAPR